MLEKFAFGPRNKPHPSSPTALAHNAKPQQASSMTYTGETNSKGEPHGQGTARCFNWGWAVAGSASRR